VFVSFFDEVPHVPCIVFNVPFRRDSAPSRAFLSLNPQTGKILKQARLSSAAATYLASPIAGDGKIYVSSVGGHVVVIQSGPEWQVLNVNEFSEPIFATPAIVGQDLLIRTKHTLFCFRKN
jgi:hypothetical protein